MEFNLEQGKFVHVNIKDKSLRFCIVLFNAFKKYIFIWNSTEFYII